MRAGLVPADEDAAGVETGHQEPGAHEAHRPGQVADMLRMLDACGGAVADAVVHQGHTQAQLRQGAGLGAVHGAVAGSPGAGGGEDQDGRAGAGHLRQEEVQSLAGRGAAPRMVGLVQVADHRVAQLGGARAGITGLGAGHRFGEAGDSQQPQAQDEGRQPVGDGRRCGGIDEGGRGSHEALLRCAGRPAQAAADSGEGGRWALGGGPGRDRAGGPNG